MRELVMVPFHGDGIEATKDERGVWASLRRMCESLGLDYSSQLYKLKKRPWGNVVINPMLDSAGRKFEMAMLHLDSVPMWLATIEASRVKEEVRPKLELYQKEAARVLADHFLAGQRVAERLQGGNVEAAAELILERLEPKLNALVADFRQKQAEPRYTLRERLNALGWLSPSDRQRKHVRELALTKLRRAGYPHPERDGLAPASELLFPASQCYLVDEAIDQIWSECRYRERGGLFEPATA